MHVCVSHWKPLLPAYIHLKHLTLPLLHLAQHPCFCFLNLPFDDFFFKKIQLLCVYFCGAAAPVGRTPETQKRNRDRKGNMFDTWREYLFLCLLKWFQLRSVTNSNHISGFAGVRQIFFSWLSVTVATGCERYAKGLAPLPIMLSSSDLFFRFVFQENNTGVSSSLWICCMPEKNPKRDI